jgi:phage shock protein PspC (stress-responsive transcriptional regulator)
MTTSQAKRLYRTRDDHMIAGVCAGIAEYFDVDPTLIRIIFVLLALAGGPGLLAYLILWVIMPERPTDAV